MRATPLPNRRVESPQWKRWRCAAGSHPPPPAGAPAQAAARPSPHLDAGASGSGADAAPAAEAACCGATGGVALGGGRINFKVSSGALLRPAPMAPQGGGPVLGYLPGTSFVNLDYLQRTLPPRL